MCVMPSAKFTMPHKIELVSIILPTYDEAGNIADLIRAVHAVVSHPHEIIVVDDHSPDGTSRIVADMISRNDVPGLRLETRMQDRGLTKSIWRGIELARGDVIVWMDCDFSMPPAKIPALLEKIHEGYDIVVGSRFVYGGNYKRGVGWFSADDSALAVLLSRIINFFMRWSLFPSFHDYTSGFIAIRRAVFRQIRLTGDYGEYFMDLICRAMLLRHSVTEIPYVCVPRRAGESKTGATFRQLFRRGIPYLAMLFRLWGMRLRVRLKRTITDRDALPV